MSGVKLSLEDEGSTFEDLKIMSKITKSLNLNLNIKIGGCEAINDIIFCKSLRPKSIVAPMVESQYALRKFVESVGDKKKIELLINIETSSALKNINKIVKSKYFKMLDGVVIGRSDLARSLNLEKSEVNSLKIFNHVMKNFKKIKKNTKKDFLFKMGGSITPASQVFIRKLFKKKLLNRIETRNAEFILSEKVIKNLKQIIQQAWIFEIEWLKFKLKNSKLNSNKFYKKYLGKHEYEYLLNNLNEKKNKYASYNALFQSTIAVGCQSTLLKDKIGRKEKILSCNLTNFDMYNFPIKGFCSINNCDYKVFSTRLKRVKEMSIADYFQDINPEQAMFYDPKESTIQKIKSVLRTKVHQNVI